MRVGITPPSSLFLVCSLVSDENLRRCERTAVPQVVRIEHILTQRLQQKYLAELKDIAGATNRQLSDRLVGVDAMRVLSGAACLRDHGGPLGPLALAIITRFLLQLHLIPCKLIKLINNHRRTPWLTGSYHPRCRAATASTRTSYFSTTARRL